MNNYSTKQLRVEIAEYTERSTSLAVFIFMTDAVMYIAAIAGTIFLEILVLRILCGIIAGLKIASIFAIAHDSAHASFASNKILNKVIARLAFLPCYHNYSLWLLAHNKLHHQSTNLQDGNSWSPLSKEEYRALPEWRKIVERFYRSPFGISFYYLIERWWKDKFFPYKRLVTKNKPSYWLDFLLVSTYMGIFLWMLIQVGVNSSHTSSVEMLILAFILPSIVGSFVIGFTVYEQHTHESIPWFRSKEERDKLVNIEEVIMYVKFPRWYNVLSHNAMEHTAHHIDSRIPSYHLAKAQNILVKLLGDDITTVKFTIKDFLSTMQKCKLYDYENYCWLDFDGIPSSESNLIKREVEIKYAQAA